MNAHIDEADIKLFCGVATLKISSDVDVVISYDACDDVRGGNALCPLGWCEHSCGRF